MYAIGKDLRRVCDLPSLPRLLRFCGDLGNGLIRVSQQTERCFARGLWIAPGNGFQNTLMFWNEDIRLWIVGGRELKHVGQG